VIQRIFINFSDMLKRVNLRLRQNAICHNSQCKWTWETVALQQSHYIFINVVKFASTCNVRS